MSTGSTAARSVPNSPGASARANTARQIRDARDLLSGQASSTREFDYELLQMFVKNELGAALTVPMLAIIVALGAMFWAPTNELLVWLSQVFIAKGILLALARQFSLKPQSEVDVETWRAKFTAAEFLYGVTWASVVFVEFNSQDQSAYIFIFATIIVVLSLRMMFAFTVMPIVYAGTIPMTAALVLRFGMMDNPFFWALAAMTVGVHMYFLVLMTGLNSTVRAMLGYRAEKDALIAELEQAKSISDGARRRAEEANLAKSRFLATMSHELRTPLNAILGFSEVMKTEILGKHAVATYKDYAADIHTSGQHLLNLINEILDLSRIEAGRYELNEEPVTLADIAEDCHRLLKLKANNKSIEIVDDFPEGLPQLWADERALRQICLNLLSNAVKFTPRGGMITIRIGASPEGGQFLAIRDTGPGIPEEEIPRVLSTFGQGSLAHQTAEGGTGLGLPIVKNLVDLHGGVFELKSKLRQGTEVVATFPPERVLHVMPRLAEPGEGETAASA